MESSTAAPSSTGSSTIADLMGLAAERYADHPAVSFKRGDEWVDVTYREVGEIVSEIARGLIDLGLAQGDRAAILCSTRPEWTYASFGISSAAGVVVPIYPTNSPEECEWVAGNSESRFLFAEDAEQAAKIAQVRDRLPNLEAVIVLDGSADGAITLDELRERGRGRVARRGGRARGGREARGPVHVHLHVGHDRAAQGLRPPPRQLPLRGDDVRGREHPARGRRRLPVPAARPLVRAADRADRDRPRRQDRLLGRRSEGHRRRADGGQAALPAVGPADLREDLHARDLQRRPGEDPRRHAARPQGPRAPGGRPAGPGRAAGDVRQGRRGAVQERPQRVRRADAAGHQRRGADRAGDPRVLLRLRRAGARGLRHDRDGDGLDRVHARTPTSSAPSGGRCRAPRSGSPKTARSSSRARTSSTATTRWRTSRSARSRTAGCTPATSARSTRTASCPSPAARRTSSSRPAARTSRPPTSRTTSSSRAGSPRRSCTATAAPTRWR